MLIKPEYECKYQVNESCGSAGTIRGEGVVIASVVQRIERRFPEPLMWVQFPPEAPLGREGRRKDLSYV